MALYTRLRDEDVAEIASAFGLGRIEAVTGIEAGTINSNYRLDAGGAAWFARVNEGKAEDEVAYEAELVSWLADREVPTPRPRPAGDGRPYARCGVGFITLFPWVPGGHRAAIGPGDTRAAGEALARVHLAGAGFPVRRASRYAFARMAERWQRCRDLPARPADAADVARALADAGDEIDRLTARAAERDALPAGIIHGDLFPDNVLFDGPRLSALLDFEQASDGCLVYDLAVVLCSWCYGDDFRADLAAALVAGYQSVRPLGAGERAAFAGEARAAAMRFTVTRLSDVALHPQASEATRNAKDFRRFHARLQRLRDLGEPGFARLCGL